MTEQTTRKRGPLKLANPRDNRASTMLTDIEYERLLANADSAGVTISDYIRRLLAETEKG